ncbi:unnamed protein product [Moneuplotes crassus]|uniref:Secreted protein n=1 Tax=Euplotes crassus TaxID=5936 RepID=A0AAD1XZ57_EUPCR|nr:unnamed protein product [Moneuplotes crassus]
MLPIIGFCNTVVVLLSNSLCSFLVEVCLHTVKIQLQGSQEHSPNKSLIVLLVVRTHGELLREHVQTLHNLKCFGTRLY